jgi:hypothetical protein
MIHEQKFDRHGRRRRLVMPPKPAVAATAVRQSRAHFAAIEPAGDPRLSPTQGLPAALPADALDDRIAIVVTAGSGKTYEAKGFVERLLDIGARVAIVDPLGVWWGLRASADGSAGGYPVVVFGGRHGDVPITAQMGAALGRMNAREALVCVVDLCRADASSPRFPKRYTRRTRNRCTSSSTKPICGRRSGRCPIRPGFWATSRKSSAAAGCAASSRG